MCIFSSEVAVEKTIITAWKQTDRHFMAYQNKVVSKTPNVMMLPIPTNSEFTFHDTTPYSGFLSEIGMAVYKDHMKGSRGLGPVEKSFTRVGQYRFAQVQPKKVKSTLKSLKQPLPIWLDKMLEVYMGWTWLFCIMDANTSMDSQPLLIEFDSLFPNELYFPAMDVHGNDEPALKVERNHILAVGAEVIDEPVISSNDLVNFPWKNLEFGGAVLENPHYFNGDFFMYEKENHRYGMKIKDLYNAIEK